MKHIHPAVEVELKLAVPPAAIHKLFAHRLLRGRARPVTRKLYSVYYDTPGFDLWRKGVTLRLRRDNSRWLQTVKSGGEAQAGLHRRNELESELAGPHPDLAFLRGGDLAEVFAPAHLRAQLRPVFVTEFNRSSRLIDLGPDTAVEASINSGEIRGGERADAVSELELELKKGPAWQLFDLALKLLKDVPLAVEDRSKAERGFALARGGREAPVKARPALLVTDMTVNEAFKAVMWASLAHLNTNTRGMLGGGDPEYLHQMRVALRRLRSAFNVFAPVLPQPMAAALAAELKWLAGALGPARDWDVFVAETLPPIHAEFGRHEALAAFSEQCARLRRAAGRKARRAVAAQRYQYLVLSLAGWLTAEEWLTQVDHAGREKLAVPVRDFASPVLDERYSRVRKRGRKLAGLPPGELHRLRIEIKKFRYATDFFAGLYEGTQVRDALKRLARLQDILGAINDAATVGNLVRQALRGADTRRVAEARGILVGWSHGRAATLKRELKSAWNEFRSAERFW